MFTFLNDTFLPASEAALNVSDLSIQRGYGIFDYFKTINGKPVFLDDHLDRFFYSAGRMRLNIGRSRDELKAVLAEVQQRNAIPDSGIRITLTGGLSPDSISMGQPNLVITQHAAIPPGRECTAPIRVITWSHQRQLPEIKTIDYLMAIHLQPHIHERGAADVLYHQNGIVTECPRCNFVIVTRDGTLATPVLNVLKGITRKQILKLAVGAGLPVEERDVHIDEIKASAEAFITSTSRHIVPVSHVDDHAIGSATACPGPVATRLNELLYNLANS